MHATCEIPARMKTTSPQLHEVIESSVEQIMSASCDAVVTGIEQAFGRRPARSKRVHAGRDSKRSMAPRRPPEEIAELSQRFIDAVTDMPGETMAVLAPKLGVPPVRLQVPITHLLKQGRIKAAGQRQFKRYFPVGAPEASD